MSEPLTEPLTQEVADRIIPRAIKHLRQYPYLSLDNFDIAGENLANVAVVLAKLAVDHQVLGSKYRRLDKDELYDSLDTLIEMEEKGEKIKCEMVFVKGKNFPEKP
jgi:hypothetical protein